MSELKERILNGSVNVFLIGLPIALVLIFGEKFSLWINILAVAYLLFVSALLSNIFGDEDESPRRILHALIGAAIAVCLKALAYPGHTAVIIMTTILIICLADIINRGHVLWFRFLHSSRLRLLGKFILVTTFIFIISLVIANFGSQKIWIPIVAASLIIMVLLVSDNYLELRGMDEDKAIFTSIGTLFLTGITSTIIQFSAVEIFWGIKIWQAAIDIALIIIAIVILIIVYKKRKRKAALRELRAKNEIKELKLMEEARIRREEEEAKETKKKLEIQQGLEQIKSNQRALTVHDLSFLYDNGKDLAAKLIFQKNIDEEDFCPKIMVSNNKKKIVWDGHLRDALYLLAYVAKKEFDDEKLNNIIVLIDIIRVHVSDRKTEEGEYEGEARLDEMLKDIENSARAKDSR